MLVTWSTLVDGGESSVTFQSDSEVFKTTVPAIKTPLLHTLLT